MMKKAEDIKLASIIRVIDGPIALLPCVSLNFYERCEECTDELYCGIRDVMKDVRDATLKILTETSVADMINREEAMKHKLEEERAHNLSDENFKGEFKGSD